MTTMASMKWKQCHHVFCCCFPVLSHKFGDATEMDGGGGGGEGETKNHRLRMKRCRRGARRKRASRSAEDSATPGFLNTLKKRKNPTVAFEPSERQVDRVVVGPVFCFSFSCFVRLKLVSLILLGQM